MENKNTNWYENPLAIALVAVVALVFLGLVVSAIGNTQSANEQLQEEQSANVQEEPVAEFKPVALKGNGDDATNDVEFAEAGNYRVAITHKGKSNLVVYARGSEPGTDIQLLNEIGEYSGSKILSVEVPGKYIVDVQADGAWTLKITK